MKKVAVVILNYNGWTFLEKFLPTVIRHTGDDAEIIVADNASSDDSVSNMKAHFPQIRLIINDTNGGFSTGYNLALRQIDAKYYVLLNSDIEVTPNWINPIIELMETDESIAACQPKILSYHDKIHFEYAGAGGGFIDRFGYPFCRGRLFQSIEIDEGQYNDTIEVFWASGACMFVRAELYHKFGGLDDEFFAHMEEIDFCWRLKNNGYKIMYCYQSIVFHIGGGTLPKISSRKTYLNFRNNLSLLYKNLPDNSLYYVIILRLFLDGLASIKFLFEGGIADFIAVLRAHSHFYRKIPQLRAKRKLLNPKTVSKVYQKNIALDHFIGGVMLFKDLEEDNFS
ncbi:MAG: glycosyltransferase family 2 protein [Bacteroidales bacterium]|nr:glycosyltransferase family 2 protein [Bacteroidales bacterium]